MHHMSLARRLLIVVVLCSLVAWLAGPAGRLVVVLALLLGGPGYLLVRGVLADALLPSLVRPALWLGLSFSLVVVLYEWATVVGLALTTPVLGGLLAGCGLAVVVAAWRDTAAPAVAPVAPASPWAGLARAGPWVGLLAVLGLTTWTRFAQIADLALPPWVDSVHHALLIRVAAEQGFAPYSLAPYLPIERLPYHWGYHVVLAALMQLSGLGLPETMLWAGQLFNVLHVLVVAALASYLWRQPLAGVAAGLVVGLLSIMPAYYVSWGRYTQLTGLLLLPPLVIAWHASLHAPIGTRLARGWLLCLTLLLAGLFLIHVRVLLFAGLLLVLVLAAWLLRNGWGAFRARLPGLLLVGAGVLLLTGPWLGVVAARILLPAVEQPATLVSRAAYNVFSEGLLWSGHTRWLVVGALAAALAGLWQRRVVAVLLLGWVVGLVLLANLWLLTYLLPLLGVLVLVWSVPQRRYGLALAGVPLLLANPWLLRVPSFWLISNDSVIITLYLPLALLLGGGVALLWESLGRWLGGRGPLLARAALLLLLTGLAGAGTADLRTVINPVTVIATEADAAAITWAAEHTPPDARFLINATAWLPAADRGTDGGWWLLPLAGRWISTPPVLFGYGPPDYVAQVRERNAVVTGFEPGRAADQQALRDLISQAGITHMYLSEQGPLTPDVFANDEGFETVYEQDGVAILAVRQ